jgi:hypothetical protein
MKKKKKIKKKIKVHILYVVPCAPPLFFQFQNSGFLKGENLIKEKLKYDKTLSFLKTTITNNVICILYL